MLINSQNISKAKAQERLTMALSNKFYYMYIYIAAHHIICIIYVNLWDMFTINTTLLSVQTTIYILLW